MMDMENSLYLYLIIGVVILATLSLIIFYTISIKKLSIKKKRISKIVSILSKTSSEIKKSIRKQTKHLSDISNLYTQIEQKKIAAEQENKILKESIQNSRKTYEHTSKVISELGEKTKKLDEINAKIASLADLKKDADIKIQSIKETVDLYERLEDFERYGLFENPDYLFATSKEYVQKIKEVRKSQKELISNDSAIIIKDHSGIPFYYIEKACTCQKRLMLRAFNIECDFLIGKVNPANFERTIERIRILADGLESDVKDADFIFNEAYIQLKCQECLLQYQYRLKKKEGIEEQKALKAQMREEERAREEYESAIIEAQNEEKKYQQMIDDTQKALQKASKKEKDELLSRIEFLENELDEARKKGERAKSMAEQTKRGYVYIISNIGSFGAEVIKIGLTRRLDPTERVRELGDASVPFAFDIHAMIASEDAPALEKELHRAFAGRRVNAVNMRKEFFRVSLEEIKSKVEEITGNNNDFIMTMIADEYYQTKRLRSRSQG